MRERERERERKKEKEKEIDRERERARENHGKVYYIFMVCSYEWAATAAELVLHQGARPLLREVVILSQNK